MTIIRHDPWNRMEYLYRDLDNLLTSRVVTENQAEVSDWVPAVDVAESGEGFVIRADLPGVDAKDVDVTMEKGVLSIQGTRLPPSDGDTDGYKRNERVSGRFFRRFALPDTSDTQAIAAQAKNGVLEIRIPKKPQVQPLRIQVSS